MKKIILLLFIMGGLLSGQTIRQNQVRGLPDSLLARYTITQVNTLLSQKIAYSDTTSLIPTKPYLSLNYYTKTQANTLYGAKLDTTLATALLRSQWSAAYNRSISVANDSTNWNTAYTDRMKWDGGSAGLVAATGRTSLGLGTIVLKDTSYYYRSTNPSNFIALTSLSSSALGLTYTNTTGVFSWTSGYAGLTDSMRTLWSGKQTYYANLSSIGALANSNGWLKNNGSGTFSYSTPSRTDIGLGTMSLVDSVLYNAKIASIYAPKNSPSFTGTITKLPSTGSGSYTFGWTTTGKPYYTILGASGEAIESLDSLGRRGIGTTAPSSKLQVGDNTPHSANTLTVSGARDNTDGDIPFANLYLSNSPTVTGGYGVSLQASHYADNYGSRLDFLLGKPFVYGGANANSFTAMSILGSGNVGIGTTGPGAKLEVADGTGLADLFIKFNGENDFRMGYLAGSTSFRIQDATTDRLVIDNLGNVGIGYTSDPTSGNKFFVNGNVYFNGIGTFTSSVTATALTLSSGAFTGNATTRGADAFTTTATADTVTISGATVNDVYIGTYITAVTAAEAPLSIVATATGFIATRPAGTTSGAQYAWIREK